jgi:hypothetical protein
VTDDEKSPMQKIRNYVEQYREGAGSDVDLETVAHQWVRDWAHKLTSNER